jgi:hypothetical protein
MEQSQVQLLSDAVKIGFPVLGTISGALIGGISTYFITRLKFENEYKKETIKRNQDLLIQIVMQVTEFEHVAGMYTANVTNTIKGNTDPMDTKISKEELRKNHHALRKARASLRVLGLEEELRLLEEYIELTREVFRYETGLTDERASKLLDVIARGPEKFYSAISNKFLKPM